MTWGGSTASRFWPSWLVIWLLGAAVILWDPFEIGDATEIYSADVFHKIVAADYPLWNTATPRVRDHITVVVVQDETVENTLHTSWPMPYRYHARILRRILEQRPAAVFVDFLFLDQERNDPTLSELTDVISEYEDAGIPLVFADASTALGPVGRIISPLRRPKHLAQVAWSRQANRMPTYPPRVHPEREASTPTFRVPDERGAWTPAFALYRTICGTRHEPRRHASSAFCRNGPLPRANKLPMLHVDWGGRPADENSGPEGTPCSSPQDSVLARVLSTLLSPQSAPLDCAYHATILADEFLTHRARSHDLGKLIRGDVVFFGGMIAGSADFVHSPLHGRLPGVHLHAMAFDNLATYGASYKGAVGLNNGLVDADDALAILALPFFLAVFWLADRIAVRGADLLADRDMRQGPRLPDTIVVRVDNSWICLGLDDDADLKPTLHRLLREDHTPFTLEAADYRRMLRKIAAIVAWASAMGTTFVVVLIAFARYGLPPADWIGITVVSGAARFVLPLSEDSYGRLYGWMALLVAMPLRWVGGAWCRAWVALAHVLPTRFTSVRGRRVAGKPVENRLGTGPKTTIKNSAT